MSLRGNNRNLPVLAKDQTVPARSLRPGASVVARPNRSGLKALQTAMVRETVSTGNFVGFIVDATASRGWAWLEAQKTQAAMFDAVGNMNLRLVHFGGGNLTARPWEENKSVVARIMASVECRPGLTQIVEALSGFLEEKNGPRANSIIVVGDAFEESVDELFAIAQRLAEKGIKVYPFQEGEDLYAEGVFKQLATMTGGVYAKFGSEMSLSDLCEGVALMTVGGVTALRALHNGAVQKLLLANPAP